MVESVQISSETWVDTARLNQEHIQAMVTVNEESEIGTDERGYVIGTLSTGGWREQRINEEEGCKSCTIRRV